MTRAQLRSKAFEVAAGLIDAMDLEQFWGEEVWDSHSETDLTLYKASVVRRLREIESMYSKLTRRPSENPR